MAVHDGTRRAGAGPDRELARGLGQRHPRRAGDGDRGRRDRRRGGAPDPPLPDRPDRARARGDRGRRLAPAGQRPVRPLHPHAPAGSAASWPAARPPRRCGWSPSTTAPGRRSATGWRPSATAAWCCAPASRTSPTTRPASCGSGRSARRRACPAPGPRSRPGPWKTAIVFWGVGSEAPGWLVSCLSEFAARDVNLTRIESRPRKQGLGRYMFFADLEGRADEPHVADALEATARARRGAAGARFVSRSRRERQLAWRAAHPRARIQRGSSLHWRQPWPPQYQRQCGPRRLQSTSGAGVRLAGCSS